MIRRMWYAVVRWLLLAFTHKRRGKVQSEAALGYEAAHVSETHAEFMARAREHVKKLREFYGQRPRPWRVR